MAGDGVVRVEIRGDIMPIARITKPSDVIKAVMNRGEIVRKVQAREYEVVDRGRTVVELPSIPEDIKRAFAAACGESQPPLSDFAAVLTAVMALSEQEQQQVYEALYKAGHRIYRE